MANLFEEPAPARLTPPLPGQPGHPTRPPARKPDPVDELETPTVPVGPPGSPTHQPGYEEDPEAQAAYEGRAPETGAAPAGCYYLATDQSLSLGGNIVLPGTRIDLSESEVDVYGGGTWVHGLTKERCEELVKAGILFTDKPRASRKHLRGKVALQTGEDDIVDASPELRDAEKRRLDALKAGTRSPIRWTFTDAQLRGKTLAQLNAMIVERGGAPQKTEDDAISLLQSELKP